MGFPVQSAAESFSPVTGLSASHSTSMTPPFICFSAIACSIMFVSASVIAVYPAHGPERGSTAVTLSANAATRSGSVMPSPPLCSWRGCGCAEGEGRCRRCLQSPCRSRRSRTRRAWLVRLRVVSRLRCLRRPQAPCRARRPRPPRPRRRTPSRPRAPGRGGRCTAPSRAGTPCSSSTLCAGTARPPSRSPTGLAPRRSAAPPSSGGQLWAAGGSWLQLPPQPRQAAWTSFWGLREQRDGWSVERERERRAPACTAGRGGRCRAGRAPPQCGRACAHLLRS